MSRSNRWRVASFGMLVGLTLASCGAGGSGDDAGGSGTPDELVVWTSYTSDGQLEALERQNALWEEEHPDIPIEHVSVPSDQLPSKLMATATTQEGPDVLLDNVVVDYPALVSGGVLADLTEYWNSYEDKDLFSDSAIWTTDDQVYNVMSYTNLLGLYYNKDILDEYGIDPPTTMAEFEAAMHTIAEDGAYEPLVQAGAPTVGGAWMFMPALLGEGVNYCNFEGAPVHEAFTRIEEWAEQGYVPRGTATWDQPEAWTQFMRGKYAFGINGNWNLGDVPDAPFEVGTTRFPAGSEGSHVFPGGEGIAIGAFSEHKDLAWEYIETAWLSAEASRLNMEASGQIPVRSDLADDPVVTEDDLVQPFVDAAADTSPWPQNEETAAMQEAIGEASSAVFSGQLSAEEAAEQAIADVAAAREEGGGSC